MWLRKRQVEEVPWESESVGLRILAISLDWMASPLKSLEGSVDCALSGKADGLLGRDNPLNYGGAQAEVWHGADGHPLIERCPAGSRVNPVRCGS